MHPKLKDLVFRGILIKLCISLFFTICIGYSLYQFVQFVEITKEISTKFHAIPSHVYEYGQETAYYGCICADLPEDTVVCTKCVPEPKSHVKPDTPEQIFERSLSHLWVYTCPSSTTEEQPSKSYCYIVLKEVLRLVLYSQEEMLSWFVKSAVFNIYLIYLYYFPYVYYHQLLERNSALNVSKTN